MPLETGDYLDNLVVTNPVGSTDPKSQGDNHLRLIKAALKNTFPGMAGRAWRFQEKAGNYTVVVTDNMSVIQVTGASKDVDLPAAATAGNGFMLMVHSDAAGTTVTPNGVETINGVTGATLVVEGAMATFLCDGVEWYMTILMVSSEPATGGPVWQCWKQPNQDVEFTTGVLITFEGWPQDCDITEFIGAVKTVSSSGSVIFDVHKNGTTMMATNKMTIEANEKSTLTAATQPAITTSSVARGDQIQAECDNAGTGATGWMIYALIEPA